jgi:poly-gamma-glutamate capsule biosynthesis protein CapA/YwtB (metallophosphatase superfamily)
MRFRMSLAIVRSLILCLAGMTVPFAHPSSAIPATAAAGVVTAVLGVSTAGPTAPATSGGMGRGLVLADFELGHITLGSYDGQDHDPDAWELTQTNTHGGSAYSLRITGNTWKTQAIAPLAITPASAISVAAYVERIGEMQGFGVTDGTNVLFYTFAGTELPTTDEYEVTYQGAFPDSMWNVYLLQVGRDWHNRYGYDPVLTALIYVNDRDSTSRGAVLFDDVVDVTSDLPVAPQVEIIRGRDRVTPVGDRMWRVGVQFASNVQDPDSDVFTYHWDFGDSSVSTLAAPYHEFLVTALHTYTVMLSVQDETGLWGRDTTQVRVDPAPVEMPVTIDFVGDVMLARGYDTPGGLIDQHGPEYIFVPTRPVFGDAAEVNVCNLECPLTDEGTPHPTKSIVFRGRPSNVHGLSYAGIDVVSIGNNHIVDYGARGCEETIEVLDAERIPWCGAGLDEYQAFQPTIRTEKGIALGFLGMCNRTGREYNYQPFLDAANDKPGFAWLTEPNLDAHIAALRPLADLVVIEAHAGIEYATDPGRHGSGLSDGSDAPLTEPPYDAVGTEPGIASDFLFATRPALTDRQLKQHAIDQGADLVIGHHPHVLQGFEVYQGHLIVHSLGNFVFDQSYAETMPSVILYSEFDKTGFREFTFRPAFIDDLIPRPASGRLGREILDRQADYSRELGTTVTVDPVRCVGTIHLDPSQISWDVLAHEKSATVAEQAGGWTSIPIEIDGTGSLSRITGIDGASGNVEVRVGREILWHGDMEDEGATFWDLNSVDEVYDATVAHSGTRSLRQHRTTQNTGYVTTDLQGYPPTLGGTDFSVCGWLRTQNALETTITARFFTGRGGNPSATADAGPAIDGTHDWTYQTADFTVPETAAFMNVRFRMNKPATGESFAWFDDVRLVEWEAWQSATLPLAVAGPNNLRFVQVRASIPTTAVTVHWEDQRPAGPPADVTPGGPVTGPASAIALRLARPYPNPVREEGAIDYLIPRAGRVTLEVYDVTGRRVAVLVDDVRTAGWHRARWNAKGIASGAYLCRLACNGDVKTGKILVVH